jgi:hypothetical protein
MIKVNWTELKAFSQLRKQSIQYIERSDVYFLWCFDGPMAVACDLLKSPSDTTDLLDFENNFKSAANASPRTYIQETATEVSLKSGSAKSTSDANGLATILMKIPGTRYVKSGQMWFSGTLHPDDSFKVLITDEDNILGYGAGAIVGGYIDTQLPADNQKTYINIHKKYAELESISGVGKLVANLYIKIIAQTGDNRVDTFYATVAWGIA